MKFIIAIILWFQMSLLTSSTVENSGYKVYTAMRKGYQGVMRDFEIVSQWTPSRPVSGEIFPNMFFGLNARHLLVATLAVSLFLRSVFVVQDVWICYNLKAKMKSSYLQAKNGYVPVIDEEPHSHGPLCSHENVLSSLLFCILQCTV